METCIEGKPHLSLDCAVQFLETTRPRILMLLKKEELSGSCINGNWFVSRESLERIKTDGASAPSLPSCKTSCSASKCGCGS